MNGDWVRTQKAVVIMTTWWYHGIRLKRMTRSLRQGSW
jgi:hypothetical protein